MDHPEQATDGVKRELQYAWAAGFMDGDGSITILRNNVWNGGRGFHLRIEASGVEPKPLQKLMGLFGGTISNGYGRPIHSWRVDASKARAALKAMLPYLTHKRDQAEIGIRFQNHVDRWHTWKRAHGKLSLPDHVFEERAKMRDILKNLHIRPGRRPAAATTDSEGPASAGK